MIKLFKLCNGEEVIAEIAEIEDEEWCEKLDLASLPQRDDAAGYDVGTLPLRLHPGSHELRAVHRGGKRRADERLP